MHGSMVAADYKGEQRRGRPGELQVQLREPCTHGGTQQWKGSSLGATWQGREQYSVIWEKNKLGRETFEILA